MKLRSALLAVASAVLGLGLAPVPAHAVSPWTPYQESDFSVPAGVGCTFAVDAHIVRDHEAYRDVATYDDGTVMTQLWKGLLVIEFTNHETGTSVTKNVNGRALINYAPDGSFVSITLLSGHFTAVVPPGNALEPGVYYVGGPGTTMTIGDTLAERSFEFGRTGSAENLCSDLAG